MSRVGGFEAPRRGRASFQSASSRQARASGATYASLFPGVDGFARSLHHELLEIQEPVGDVDSEVDAATSSPDEDSPTEAQNRE